jgi:catechol 2,3-dioxygenase
MNYTLSSQISISEVELTIRDLDRSISFYTQVMGFHLREQNSQSAELGTETTTLIRLFENPQANISRSTTGLYHFAILVPHRQILARALKNIIETQTPVQGFADHGVSEAIYLTDPDSNGIEIYWDRPRQEWPFKNDELQMITDPLKVENLLAELNGDRGGEQTTLPADTTIGHMHLHVRNIPEAVSFYRDVLGLNLIQRYGPSAAFLAAGDYHHHIGINTWAGVGAPLPPDDAVGLRSFTITLPKSDDLKNLEQNIRKTSTEMTHTVSGFSVQDPSGNHIRFRAA